MSDTQAALDGLTLADLQAGRKALYQAKLTGTLSVQFPDGTRVQYRALAEIDGALRDVDSRILAATAGAVASPLQQPVRVFRMRPWNGFR